MPRYKSTLAIRTFGFGSAMEVVIVKQEGRVSWLSEALVQVLNTTSEGPRSSTSVAFRSAKVRLGTRTFAERKATHVDERGPSLVVFKT